MAYSHRLAYIITGFLQAVAYGMNIISFAVCMSVLLTLGGKLRPLYRIPWLMTSAALAMFCIATADAVVEVHYITALFFHENPKALLEFEGIFQWWSVVSFSFYVVQTWIGDSVLIYRCFVVWNRKFRMISVSLLTSIAGLAFGIGSTILGSTRSGANRGKGLTPLVVSFYVMALATNLITSSLIVSRIWNVKRGTSRYRTFSNQIIQQDPLSRAIRVTMEAGFIYTIALIGIMIIYLVYPTSQFAVQRLVVQIIGITFNVIIDHSQRKYDENPAESSSFQRISTQTPMVITKDVVVSRDPPTRLESGIHNRDDHDEHITGSGKVEDKRISWADP